MTADIAVVEADGKSSRALCALLTGQGYRVVGYPTLGAFLDAIMRRRFEALLMNMNLPGMEGREMMRALRANPRTRRMVLVGLSDGARPKEEVVAAFQAGADEYLFKPVDADLLVVRLATLLRRGAGPPPESVLRHGGITVFPERRVCEIDAKKVRLTRLEFDLLVQFIGNANRVLTRGHLIDALWRGGRSAGARAVDRHIHALRTKLGRFDKLLQTVVGMGYRMTGGLPGRNGSGSQAAGVLSGSSK